MGSASSVDLLPTMVRCAYRTSRAYRVGARAHGSLGTSPEELSDVKDMLVIRVFAGIPGNRG